jgi:NitT/TauT family transport system substrate-binding protein
MDGSYSIRHNIGAGASACHRIDMPGRLLWSRILRRRPMKKKRAFSGLLATLIGLTALLCLGGGAGRAEDVKQPLAVQISFDRPLEASMAPFIVAENRGLFAAEGLLVRNDFANGSSEAIARVASGASDFALVDINELIRFRSKADAPAIKAVFVLFNQSPYAVVARKSRGVHALADIEGKTVGVAESDLSFHLWPALARQNGIKMSGMKIYKMSAAVREPILSAGQVDAVAGFSYLSAVNLRDRGVPAGDLAVLRYNDYGCEAYGFAVIVNPALAAAKPDAVNDVVGRMEDGTRDLELERLRTVIADNILTGEVKRNGLGGIDPTRMERAIDQVGEDFKFHKRPDAADIFDGGFLPPVGGRLIN